MDNMNHKDLSKLADNHKEREISKRTEEITRIADGYLEGILKEEITIGESKRIVNYMQAKIAERLGLHEENTFISKLNGQEKEYIVK